MDTFGRGTEGDRGGADEAGGTWYSFDLWVPSLLRFDFSSTTFVFECCSDPWIRYRPCHDLLAIYFRSDWRVFVYYGCGCSSRFTGSYYDATKAPTVFMVEEQAERREAKPARATKSYQGGWWWNPA